MKPLSPARLLARVGGTLAGNAARTPDLRTCADCWERQGVRVDEAAERRSRYRACAACAKVWQERPKGGRRRTDWISRVQVATPRPASPTV
jgi:hypothetical protein